MKATWQEQAAAYRRMPGNKSTVDDVIATWPAIPAHDNADGTPCPWSGIISESGQCPDRCPAETGEQ